MTPAIYSERYILYVSIHEVIPNYHQLSRTFNTPTKQKSKLSTPHSHTSSTTPYPFFVLRAHASKSHPSKRYVKQWPLTPPKTTHARARKACPSGGAQVYDLCTFCQIVHHSIFHVTYMYSTTCRALFSPLTTALRANVTLDTRFKSLRRKVLGRYHGVVVANHGQLAETDAISKQKRYSVKRATGSLPTLSLQSVYVTKCFDARNWLQSDILVRNMRRALRIAK